MKKFLHIITVPVFFLSALPAFAAVTQGQSINPCPAVGSGFNTLCTSSVLNNPAELIAFVVQLLLAAAVVIALIFLIIGGIRWIISGGDKTKLEAARGTVIAAIVGLIVALAAFFIINLILTILGLGGLGSFHLPILGSTPTPTP